MPTTKTNITILNQKKDDYIASFESSGRWLNYDEVSTDKLLILEAINDWSGRSLTESGGVKPTCGGDDPCCATFSELEEFIKRIIHDTCILYPISNFALNDSEELNFKSFQASYRVTPHLSGSRSDAISIAEVKRIQDVESAFQLWAFCATEDAMAYLEFQMSIHRLDFEGDESTVVRRIITSNLQERFSIGLIRNAIWRTVKAAASLSTREYYNNSKAAKTIPNKLDKLLREIALNPTVTAYDRIEQVPLGAVLTLLLTRFEIDDMMTGNQVRSIFENEKALTPTAPNIKGASDIDAENIEIHGSFYYLNVFTEFDRALLPLFNGLKFDSAEPVWDEDHVFGRLSFTGSYYYCFDGSAFSKMLYDILKISDPADEYAKNADSKDSFNDFQVYLKSRRAIIEQTLVKVGIPNSHAHDIYYVMSYPASLCDVVKVIPYIPVESGLSSVRLNSNVNQESSSELRLHGITLSIQEGMLKSFGCDEDLVLSVALNKFDHLSDILSTAIVNLISCDKQEFKEDLLTRISQKLLIKAKQIKNAS